MGWLLLCSAVVCTPPPPRAAAAATGQRSAPVPHAAQQLNAPSTAPACAPTAWRKRRHVPNDRIHHDGASMYFAGYGLGRLVISHNDAAGQHAHYGSAPTSSHIMVRRQPPRRAPGAGLCCGVPCRWMLLITHGMDHYFFTSNCKGNDVLHPPSAACRQPAVSLTHQRPLSCSSSGKL